ncbi:M23 family metallopeptidase [Psychrobacter aestuarii]|uniref:M23ase beta-sheet core domain-containing protein n=1 Tax=Psychrobacter aestuarii TaxID=556327 RepID=A0ABP3FES4_9GAMM|nr:M23 family metallopeptidase [Psychrobacter aestuarii]
MSQDAPTPNPHPTKRLFATGAKAVAVILFLFVVQQIITKGLPDMSIYVQEKWQGIRLLQEPLPSENSLPNPLPEQRLVDTWGGARSNGRTHEGIDIFAPRGTPIQSTTDGIVRKVGEDRLGGRVVSIVGPGGAGHYYAHLEDYADIVVGDWVDAGEVIGYVGDSGNAKGTPPHLHYGIYISGSAVNPYPLLQKDAPAQ